MKHKVTATSIKAACVAESFLTIYLRIECNTCQHKAWDDAWSLKLRRANKFLEKLRQRSMPGVDEVEIQVKNLEAEFAEATWMSRQMFAHGAKPRITRVKHNYYEKAASKLPQEVRPEDVVERTVKEWSELKEGDYDGNYEASTGPIHPVSTDYSYPWDNDDGSWILQHLEPEDGKAEEVSEGLDLNAAAWDWGDETNQEGDVDASKTWERDVTNTHGDASESYYKEDKPISTGLVVQDSNANMPSTNDLSTSDLHADQTEHNSRVHQVLQTFCSIINANLKQTNNLPPTPPPTPTPDSHALSNLIHDLDPETEPIDSLAPTTPPAPQDQRFWLDDAPDSPPTSPPPQRPATPPSPNSTRSWYDKQRKILKQRRNFDIEKYYVDWLYISRCEIRDFEGPEGRMIGEPVRVGTR